MRPPAWLRPPRGRGTLGPRLLFSPQASQALCTLLPVGSYRKAVAQVFPQLLMALMLQLCYSRDLRLVTGNRTL